MERNMAVQVNPKIPSVKNNLKKLSLLKFL
jgi:hypothetical protein